MTGKANFLKGMKEISSFTGYSEPTLLRMKRRYPRMPMSKPPGIHSWIADPERLDEFFKDLAGGVSEHWLAPRGG